MPDWPWSKKQPEYQNVPMKIGKKRSDYSNNTTDEMYNMAQEESEPERKQYTYSDEPAEMKKSINWVGKFGAAGMGFGMGFFVGSSVVAISGLINPQMRRMGWGVLRGQAVGAGLAFGTIFAGGQLLHTWGHK
ncbi:hypothetical protein AAMO2058_000452700 [Amorphochlora amoebiformis]